MKRIVLGVLAVLLTACTATPSSPPASTSASAEDQAKAVKTAFETYRKAALEKNGDAAVAVVASPVFDLYDGIRQKALTGKDADVAAMPASERMTVYVMRAEFQADVLRAASGRELVKASIDKGLIGEDSVNAMELGTIALTGDTARSEVITRGQKAPFTFNFVREDGAWKFDLKPVLALANTALDSLAQQEQVTVPELIDKLLASTYGPEKVQELHKPLEG